MAFLIRFFLCILIAGFYLYLYVDKQNELTELRKEIPILSKEVKMVMEENKRLDYEIERFESPIHLMEIARKPEFGHLKHPYIKDIIVISDKEALCEESNK